MKSFLVSTISFAILSACSSAQHIRHKDYYSYDWSPIGATSENHKESFEHHPIFWESDEVSKEGPPQYSKTIHYFFWGLTPWKPVVRMSKACGKQPFRQAYIAHTFGQAFVSFMTLGIYTPRTVEVWCGDLHAAK